MVISQEYRIDVVKPELYDLNSAQLGTEVGLSMCETRKVCIQRGENPHAVVSDGPAGCQPPL
jgi:hypothetical protein